MLKKVFLFTPLLLFALDTQTQNTLNALHSKSFLNQQLAKPLTGGAEFRTFNGKQTFKANLTCPAEEKAVVISFIPLGNGEWRIVVAGDLNLDGKYEKHFDTNWLGIRVSGVCTNGVVYCSPYNAWDLNHCSYYYWTWKNGFVALEKTENRDLVGACICTNAACGQNNFPPYDKVAGAVARVISEHNPLMVISKGEWDINTFSFYLYGQSTQSCSGISGQVTDLEGRPLTSYRTVYPSVDLAELALKQGSDPNSPYNTLMTASQIEYNGTKVGTPNIYTCDIRKNVNIRTKVDYEKCTNKIIVNGRIWCVAYDAFYNSGSCICKDCGAFSQSATYTFNLKKDQEYAILFTICALVGDRGRYWKAYINGNLIGTRGSYCNCCGGGPCEIFRYLGRSPQADYKVTISAKQVAYGHGKHHSYPPRIGHIYFLVGNRYLKDTFNLTVQNNCHPDEDCKLKNEWICPPDAPLSNPPTLGQLRQYCIQTVNEGTHLHPILSPVCKSVSTEIDNYQVCMDGHQVWVKDSSGRTVYSSYGDYMWFHVVREYTCGVKEMSFDLSKVNQTRDSAKLTGSNYNISYTDYVGGTGSNTIYLKLSVDNCPVPSCVVKVPKNQADVFSDSSKRENTQRYEIQILECKKNSAESWYCPVPSGGFILEGCSCQRGFTGFNLTLPTLQAVDEASHDIICSSE